MFRVLTTLLICAAAQAATSSTTLTIKAAVSTSGSSYVLTGTATLTGGIADSGTFSGSLPISALGGSNASIPFTLTLSGGTLVGTLQVPVATLGGGNGTGSATITSGTGSYAGDTGSFSSITGTGLAGLSGITVTYTGTGTIGSGPSGPAPPTISQILNNYGLVQPGFPNYGIAPGALFIVKGTGMADPSAQAVLQSSASPGIPKTLNGASISVTVGGTTVTPGIYYAIAGQVAAVLPAATPTGTGTITVSYNGTPSSASPIQVVPAALGLGTYIGSAIATNPTTGALYTYTNSPIPGDIIVLWGSGLGGIPADSDTVFTSTPHAASIPTQIYIGGIQANVLYAGDSGYPGVNQIDVYIPTTVSPGCNVSLVAVSGSGSNLVTSNTLSIPVATTEGGVCSDPAFGTSGTTTTTLSGKNTVNTGGVFLIHSIMPGTTAGTTQTNDLAEAVFDSQTGASYVSRGSVASVGSCTVVQTVTGSTSTSTALDAGTITVTGPNGTATLTAEPIAGIGISFAQLAAGFIPSSGGAFTFKGTGGANVGSFNATVNFPNPLLNWTNESANATISRAGGATVTWTGGAANTYVEIGGTSSSTSTGVSASFYCFAPQAAGQFTVPASILLSMPAGSGTMTVENETPYATFTATGLMRHSLRLLGESINNTYN